MRRLVLLNGAPGSGKSTLARRYVQDRPLALALDVDVVRSMLGGWLDQPDAAGLAARAMAIAMARAHLAGGHDVVVPQYLCRLDFLLALEGLAAAAGARFVEVVLELTAEDAAARFAHRSSGSTDQAHRDAAALLQRSGGSTELAAMYARLLGVIQARPNTRAIVVVQDHVDQAYDDLVEAINFS